MKGVFLNLRKILDGHSEHLLRIAYYYTKNLHAAEDIVQDVLLQILEQRFRLSQSIL